jgi:hypothetical protein
MGWRIEEHVCISRSAPSLIAYLNLLRPIVIIDRQPGAYALEGFGRGPRCSGGGGRAGPHWRAGSHDKPRAGPQLVLNEWALTDAALEWVKPRSVTAAFCVARGAVV